ncbi:MAG: prefoldin subunit alpha [Candidatus Methanomethylicia archaeon]|uniref:Prefoldin subunit alpha n=1 Tax=Candidatus Methanomethylicus mesodigestus TaxID=1867258 RepID=A0A7C3ERC2_9CREN|nr:prefoldin subunit alpha [Candidatus Methanomethylicia archaeon]
MSQPKQPTKLPPKEELDNLLVEFSNLKAYADAVRQQLDLTTNVIAELILSKASMSEIKSREGKGEVMIHIGAGNYIKAQLQDVKNVVIGIGAGVSVEKSLDDAITEIDSRIKQAQDQSNYLQNQYIQASGRMSQIQPRIDQLYSQIEASGQA